MEVLATPLSGLFEIKSRTFPDERGWFREFFNRKSGAGGIVWPEFVQDNLSFSKKGVIRGLHLQTAPFGQSKLVSVVCGRVLDVVVDVRISSPTFGKTYQVELSGEQQNALLIPDGFAHGFAALEDTYFFYKASNFYEPRAETGIRWNDSDLNISWPVHEPIISHKDRELPTLHELRGKLLISQHA